jgi:cytochrome c oxidase subunit 1
LFSTVFTTDHRRLGVGYLGLSLLAVALGTLMSLAMRIHLVWPRLELPLWGVVKPEDYLALVTIHGTLMLFFVVTLAPQAGFGSLILPSQIGAPRMAFPALNALAFWLFLQVLSQAARRSPVGLPIHHSQRCLPPARARVRAWIFGWPQSQSFPSRRSRPR